MRKALRIAETVGVFVEYLDSSDGLRSYGLDGSIAATVKGRMYPSYWDNFHVSGS